VRRVLPERLSLLKIDAAGLGLCVVASLVFYWTTIEPVLQRQSLAADQRRELNHRQEKLAELKAGATRLRERVGAMQTELAGSAVKLEPARDINKRLDSLGQFLTECELEIDDVQTRRTSSGLQYDLVPITILGRGPYTQCVRFLRRLHSTYPDMSVARIEFSCTPGPTAKPAKFQFDLLWYAAADQSPVVQDGVARGEDPRLGD